MLELLHKLWFLVPDLFKAARPDFSQFAAGGNDSVQRGVVHWLNVSDNHCGGLVAPAASVELGLLYAVQFAAVGADSSYCRHFTNKITITTANSATRTVW